MAKSFKLYLAEVAEGFTQKTIRFLDRWTEGSSAALHMFTPLVKADLSKTVQDETYKVYRGVKLADWANSKEKLGVDLDHLEKGETIKCKVQGPVSWTRDKKLAEKFSNPKFDALNHEMFDEDAIEDMGYEDGESLGIGILLEAVIKKNIVVADLGKVGSNYLNYGDCEDEIIVVGLVSAKVLDVEHHVFSTQKDDTDDDDQDAEADVLTQRAANMSDHLSKLGIDDRSNGNLIDYLSDLESDAWVIPIIQYYADRTEVIDYIRKNKNEFRRAYKYHTIESMLNLRDSIHKHLASKYK